MADQASGPNEIGAASIGVSANLDALRKDFQTAQAEAAAAGQKAGEAFAQGMGEGQDGFVGPPRPTGKDEAARQWRMTQEQAGVEPGSLAAPPPAAAAGSSVFDMAAFLVAVKGLQLAMQAVTEMASSLGKTIGESLADTKKQHLELQQSMRQVATAFERGVAAREEHYQQATDANPLTRGGGVIKDLSELERMTQTAREKRQELQTRKETTGMSFVADYELRQEIDALDRQIAENEAKAAPMREQVSKVQARNRETMSLGGILESEMRARGMDIDRAVPDVRMYGHSGAAVARDRLQSESNDNLRRIYEQMTITSPERANRVVRSR